ncbi:hypothetical protein [Geofilum rubicundum]|uniref:Uncharacterized protein n=1 Tax=Geofilum rubicundum JCM 15548 TaxID=1236989 RepID=A0A0E9M2W0_9BACT|nr:hypothetical protein [Geofilum rubicundum]GAO31756.1 hypothetical protein JCM15548_14150 [Geofilum rubicundum JCM 15548]
MEFLLQLIAELFGAPEEEKATIMETVQAQETVVKNEEVPVLAEEQFEKTPNIFNVVQFH